MAKIAKLQEVSLKDLKPYANNAKLHGPEQVEQLKRSINEFGFISPILIDAEFNVIAGHGRIMAATALEMEQVPALFVEDLTDEQRRAYILADNRLTELGTWDNAILSAELQALKDDGFNIELTGFNVDFIEIEEVDFSEVDDAWNEETEEPEPEPIARPGDVYQLGRHRLMCGDSTNSSDVKKIDSRRKYKLSCHRPAIQRGLCRQKRNVKQSRKREPNRNAHRKRRHERQRIY